jgi:hypothetical protein
LTILRARRASSVARWKMPASTGCFGAGGVRIARRESAVQAEAEEGMQEQRRAAHLLLVLGVIILGELPLGAALLGGRLQMIGGALPRHGDRPRSSEKKMCLIPPGSQRTQSDDYCAIAIEQTMQCSAPATRSEHNLILGAQHTARRRRRHAAGRPVCSSGRKLRAAFITGCSETGRRPVRQESRAT